MIGVIRIEKAPETSAILGFGRTKVRDVEYANSDQRVSHGNNPAHNG